MSAKELAQLRELVWDRCAGYCEKCGVPLSREMFALHHRKLKSRGGKDTIENLVALHHYCHVMGTNSVHMNPTQGTLDGFMVASWDDPLAVPVTIGDGSRVHLLTDGTYLKLRTSHDRSENYISW